VGSGKFMNQDTLLAN